MIDRVIVNYLNDHGLRQGTSLENKVTMRLHQYDLLDEMQRRVGKYHLDYAWPELKIALEADGPHHWRPDVAMKDAVRDSWLRSRGWMVFRIDEMAGNLEEQLCRVVLAIRNCDPRLIPDLRSSN